MTIGFDVSLLNMIVNYAVKLKSKEKFIFISPYYRMLLEGVIIKTAANTSEVTVLFLFTTLLPFIYSIL